MKNRLLLAALLSASALMLAPAPTTAQERAPACTRIRTLAQCPDTGCGGPGADPLLNRMKNRTQDAARPEELNLSDIRRLSQPRRWTTGQDRSSIARNEERAVVVTGFLARAKGSGKESTNCGLSGAANNDTHLDLVSRQRDVLATAVTAEITPRVRRDHAGWTNGKLSRLARDRAFVRVTGWLMLDTQHIRSPIVRSTNWEVHPVTRFEVCTETVARCRAGNGWVDLDDHEVP
jgi:hypothetical protein